MQTINSSTKFTATTPFGKFKRSSLNHKYAFVIVGCGFTESSIIGRSKQNIERAQRRVDCYSKVVDLETFKAYCAAEDAAGNKYSGSAMELGNYGAACRIYTTPKAMTDHVADFKLWTANDRAIVATAKADLQASLDENKAIIAAKDGVVIGWRRDHKLAEQLVKQEQAWGRIVYIFAVDQKEA